MENPFGKSVFGELEWNSSKCIETVFFMIFPFFLTILTYLLNISANLDEIRNMKFTVLHNLDMENTSVQSALNELQWNFIKMH